LKYLKSLEQRDWDKINTSAVDREFKMYRKQLANLKQRLSSKTWKYFWEGFGEAGIHDARLIALSVGDGLNALPRHLGAPNKIRIKADFLNQNRKYRFTFAYSDIKLFSFDFDATLGQYLIDLSNKRYFHDADHYLKCNHLSDVLGDELTPVDSKYLRHELVFCSGARIVVQAARISFHKKPI
jgi:hypothetical protein